MAAAGAGVLGPEAFDQRGDDVAADVAFQGERRVLHPVEVAAGGVEQRSDAEPLDEPGQGCAEVRGRVECRAATGARLVAPPDPLLVDLGEDRLEGLVAEAAAASDLAGPELAGDAGGPRKPKLEPRSGSVALLFHRSLTGATGNSPATSVQ